MKKIPFLIVLPIFLFAHSAEAQRVSANQLKALLIIKIVELEKNLSSKEGEISIYVLGAPRLAEALAELEGKKVGQGELGDVRWGDGAPSKAPDIIFIGTANQLQTVLTMAREKKVMTITDRADLFRKGVSVSILTEKRRPKISLNPSASLEEGLDWDLDFTQFRSMVLEFKTSR